MSPLSWFYLLNFYSDPLGKEYKPSECMRYFYMPYTSVLNVPHSHNLLTIFSTYMSYALCQLNPEVLSSFVFLITSRLDLADSFAIGSPAPVFLFSGLPCIPLPPKAFQCCHYLIPLHITQQRLLSMWEISKFFSPECSVLSKIFLISSDSFDFHLNALFQPNCFPDLKIVIKYTFLYIKLTLILFKSYSFSKIQLKSHLLCKSFLVHHDQIFSSFLSNPSS